MREQPLLLPEPSSTPHLPCVLKETYDSHEKAIFHMMNEGGPIYESGDPIYKRLTDVSSKEHRPQCE